MFFIDNLKLILYNKQKEGDLLNTRKLNEFKKNSGLTNAKIAEITGITLSNIDKITSGNNTNPKLDTIQAICKAIGCTIDDLDDVPDNKKDSPSRWEALRPELDKLSDDEFLELFKYVEFLLWKKELELRNRQK